KEPIELACLVATQHLAPLPRAVLILRDVLGCSARRARNCSRRPSRPFNSALQRARAGMRAHLPERRLEWGPDSEPTAAERRLLDRVVEYTERADARALPHVLHEDVPVTMPPPPGVWQGRDRGLQCCVDRGFGSDAFGSLRCLITRANRQPAVANYVKRPGDPAHLPLALDVLRIQEGAVIDIVTFGQEVFPAFDVPRSI